MYTYTYIFMYVYIYVHIYIYTYVTCIFCYARSLVPSFSPALSVIVSLCLSLPLTDFSVCLFVSLSLSRSLAPSFSLPLAPSPLCLRLYVCMMYRAMEMILTGEQIDATEALRLGLVTKIFPPSETVEAAMKTAAKMASFSLPHLMMAKEV